MHTLLTSRISLLIIGLLWRGPPWRPPLTFMSSPSYAAYQTLNGPSSSHLSQIPPQDTPPRGPKHPKNLKDPLTMYQLTMRLLAELLSMTEIGGLTTEKMVTVWMVNIRMADQEQMRGELRAMTPLEFTLLRKSPSTHRGPHTYVHKHMHRQRWMHLHRRRHVHR